MKAVILYTEYEGEAECRNVLYKDVSSFEIAEIYEVYAYPELTELLRDGELNNEEFIIATSPANIEDAALVSTFFNNATRDSGWRRDAYVEHRVIDTDNMSHDDIVWLDEHRGEDELNLQRFYPKGHGLKDVTAEIYAPLIKEVKTVLEYRGDFVVLRS